MPRTAKPKPKPKDQPDGRRKVVVKAPEAMAEIGHNSIAASALEKLLQRVEGLREDRTDINSGIRDVFEEAKHAGYDPKIMRKILTWRKLPEDERTATRHKLQVYAEALDLQGLFG